MKKPMNDKHKARRGGWTRFLKVSCEHCGRFLFYYQKDGPGPLKRCYLDRMIKYKPEFDKKGYCFCKCGECLGFYEPYKRENNRPAIRNAAVAVVYETVPAKEVK